VCACHECATHGLHPVHGLEAHRFEHLPDDPRARLQVSVAAPARTVRQVNDKLDAAVRKTGSTRAEASPSNSQMH
jgi:hypothetical protein